MFGVSNSPLILPDNALDQSKSFLGQKRITQVLNEAGRLTKNWLFGSLEIGKGGSSIFLEAQIILAWLRV